MLERLLKDLASLFSFPLQEVLQPVKHYALYINPTTTLIFKELENGFCCESIIGDIPEKCEEDLLMLLLRANFLGQGTQGGMLALSEYGSSILFKQDVEETLTGYQFKEKVEEFVNYLNYWKDRINEEV